MQVPDLEYGLVVHFVERGIVEGGQKDFLDEVGGQLAPAAVAQHNPLVVEDGDWAGTKRRGRWNDLRATSPEDFGGFTIIFHLTTIDAVDNLFRQLS